MTLDDQSLFDWAFKGIVGLFVTVLSVFANKQVRATEHNRDELDAHKLNVAENYIKKDVVDRIHERIDDMSKDIKTLIGSVGNSKK